MLPDAAKYEDLRDTFSWEIPEFYNIGVDVCDKWAALRPESLALCFVDDTNAARNFSFGELRDRLNRLANDLIADGVERGDRVAVVDERGRECAVGEQGALPSAGVIR